MIVCHCNRITSGDIDEAVGCMMTNCAHPELCPENVYDELGACPRCCNCFPLVEKMIDESRLAFVSRAELARLRGAPADNDPVPPPVPERRPAGIVVDGVSSAPPLPDRVSSEPPVIESLVAELSVSNSSVPPDEAVAGRIGGAR